MVRLRPGFIFAAFQQAGPGIEQLVKVGAVRDQRSQEMSRRRGEASSRAFQTRGCLAANRRVAAMSLPVSIQ